MRTLFVDLESIFWSVALGPAGSKGGVFEIVMGTLVRLAEGFDRVAIARGGRGKSFRTNIEAGYKADRLERAPHLWATLDQVTAECAERWPVFVAPPYEDETSAEGDDVIATLVDWYVSQRGQGDRCRVVSGDSDLAALVSADAGVELCREVRQKGGTSWQVYSEHDLASGKWDKVPVPPSKIADFKALAGDSSDGYPGFAGIGPGWAKVLLIGDPTKPERVGFGTAVGVLDAAVADPPPAWITPAVLTSLRAGGLVLALRGIELATLRRDVDLGDIAARFAEPRRQRPAAPVVCGAKGGALVCDLPPHDGERHGTAGASWTVQQHGAKPQAMAPAAAAPAAPAAPVDAWDGPLDPSAPPPPPPVLVSISPALAAALPAPAPAAPTVRPAPVAEPEAPPARALALRPPVDEPRASALVSVDPSQAAWALALQPGTAKEAWILAEKLFDSGLYAKKFDCKEAIWTVILIGREHGLSAMAALQSMHVVEGKIEMSADLIVAKVLRSGLARFFTLTESTDERATWETHRVGEAKPLAMSFTVADAERREIFTTVKGVRVTKWGKVSQWQRMPEVMCMWRAATKLARAKYSDVVRGLYGEGEIRETRGEVIDADFEVTTKGAA